jgi:predicted cupin superfamily sugar epimerase
MKDAAHWISRLNLQPHPEGGFYRETYRAAQSIAAECLPGGYGGDRAFATAIYYLLEGDDFSSFHRLLSDELWHFHAGSSLVIHILGGKEGSPSCVTLGSDPDRGETLQAVIPGGTWFAAEVRDKRSFSLVGCTVAPGFEFKDFTPGKRDELTRIFPAAALLIEKLTRQ